MSRSGGVRNLWGALTDSRLPRIKSCERRRQRERVRSRAHGRHVSGGPGPPVQNLEGKGVIIMTQFEIIDDADLEQVKGGLSFSLGFDTKTGISAETPLGSFTIPSPLTIASDLITGVTKGL